MPKRREPTPLVFPTKIEFRYNYGTMPTYENFENNFVADLGWNGTYEIRAGAESFPGIDSYQTRSFTAKELYAWLKKLVTKWHRTGDDETGSIVLDVLGTLGFEWV
jgi:hypothetical protein